VALSLCRKLLALLVVKADLYSLLGSPFHGNLYIKHPGSQQYYDRRLKYPKFDGEDQKHFRFTCAASNTGISTATRLEEATFSVSHYISGDLKSQAEKVHTIWSALVQVSSALMDPGTLSDQKRYAAHSSSGAA
jgi:hypothetical protein